MFCFQTIVDENCIWCLYLLSVRMVFNYIRNALCYVLYTFCYILRWNIPYLPFFFYAYHSEFLYKFWRNLSSKNIINAIGFWVCLLCFHALTDKTMLMNFVIKVKGTLEKNIHNLCRENKGKIVEESLYGIPLISQICTLPACAGVMVSDT